MAGLVPFNSKMGLKTTAFEDFYNMLDDFFSDNWTSRTISRDTFKLDIHENDKEYCIEAELPGVKKEEIDLDFYEGRLSIKITREDNVKEERKNYVHRERRFNSMQRSIYLADAKSANISARLENGVLAITVPKEDKNEQTLKINID